MVDGHETKFLMGDDVNEERMVVYTVVIGSTKEDQATEDCLKAIRKIRELGVQASYVVPENKVGVLFHKALEK